VAADQSAERVLVPHPQRGHDLTSPRHDRAVRAATTGSAGIRVPASPVQIDGFDADAAQPVVVEQSNT
jgi:hypothetical protein